MQTHILNHFILISGKFCDKNYAVWKVFVFLTLSITWKFEWIIVPRNHFNLKREWNTQRDIIKYEKLKKSRKRRYHTSWRRMHHTSWRRMHYTSWRIRGWYEGESWSWIMQLNHVVESCQHARESVTQSDLEVEWSLIMKWIMQLNHFNMQENQSHKVI